MSSKTTLLRLKKDGVRHSDETKKTFVDKLIYSENGLHTKYVTLKGDAENVLKNGKNGASEIISEAYLKAQKSLNSLCEVTSDMLLISGASVVPNGRRNRGRTCDHLDVDQALYH